MTLSVALQRLLPQKFFGVLPLFIGVEVILGITILNKVSGLYGILSLLTGHPINFLQWLYNFLCILLLPIYASGLISLEHKFKSIRKVSLATIVYTVDTIIGTFYTIYFIYFWFTEEDNDNTGYTGAGSAASSASAAGDAVAAAAADAAARMFSKRLPSSSFSEDTSLSQSASQGRELFFIFTTTILTAAARFYFTLVMLSFTKILLKQASTELRYKTVGSAAGANSESDFMIEDSQEEEEEITHTSGILGEIYKFMYDIEIRAKDLLDELLN